MTHASQGFQACWRSNLFLQSLSKSKPHSCRLRYTGTCRRRWQPCHGSRLYPTELTNECPWPSLGIWLIRYFSSNQREDDYPSKTKAEQPHLTILHTLARMEDSVRFYGYSTIRLGFLVVAVTGLGLYVFRDFLRDNVADEVSTVASRSLADDQVKEKAQQLTVQLLNSLMTDPQVQTYTVQFLSDVIQRPQTQDILLRLLTDVMQRTETQDKLAYLSKQVATKAMEDGEFRRRIVFSLQQLLDDPAIRHTLINIIKSLLEEESVRESSKCYLKDVISSTRVTERATELGRNVVEGVVADQQIQQQTGDALWHAVKHTVTPTWWRTDTMKGAPQASTTFNPNESSKRGNNDDDAS